MVREKEIPAGGRQSLAWLWVRRPVLLAAVLGCAGAQSATPIAEEKAPTCAATIVASKPNVLPDGRTVTVDASTIVVRNGDILLLGTQTNLLSADSPWVHPAARQPIGIVRDAAGATRIVDSPLEDVEVLHPRAVSAGRGGYHVLFITGSAGAYDRPNTYDSSYVWYGRYDGRAWHDVKQIALARSALLRPRMASDLVMSKEGLAFAYAFERAPSLPLNAPNSKGMVMLVGDGKRWTADTLFTYEAPRSIQLAADDKPGVLAIFAQEYHARRALHGPALMLARHNGRWAPSSVLLDRPGQYMKSPEISIRRGAPTFVTWKSATPGRMDEQTQEWGVLDDDGVLRPRGKVTLTDALDKPAMLRVSDKHVAWFARDGESRQDLRVLISDGSPIQDLGTLRVPLENWVVIVAPLSDGRVVTSSAALASKPGEPPATGYLTEISVKCTTARR